MSRFLGKVQFLIKLLKSMKGTNHRTVVFSQSRKILNIIQKILIENQIKVFLEHFQIDFGNSCCLQVMRVDGEVRDMQEREKRVQQFQNDTSYKVFLLTVQVSCKNKSRENGLMKSDVRLVALV